MTSAPPLAAGELLGPVAVGPVAHGGHCVARYENRVVFVRHALPGERVRVRLTDTSQDRYWRGDAVEVLDASPDRVPRRCPISGPGLCGGCDFQHVDLAAQRRLKTAVVAEQLSRLAGLEWAGEVEPVLSAGTEDGLGWRTRMRYHVDGQGRAGLRAHRSHAIVPVPPAGCPIASPRTPSVTDRTWPPGAELLAVAGADESVLHVGSAGRAATRAAGEDRGRTIVEQAAGRAWAVPVDGFWQVHEAAAEVLVEAVLTGLTPEPGEKAFDLYAGVGLFAGALADRGCRVWAVESSPAAADAARGNLHDVADRVRIRADRVDRALTRLPARADLVVLDPPRTGAGPRVMHALVARRPRAIAYVACDPAALARDLGAVRSHGWAPQSVRAFDLFPMTAHVECVAILAATGPATAETSS